MKKNEIIDDDYYTIYFENFIFKHRPQKIFEKRKEPGEIGYCMIWSLMFIHARILFMDEDIRDLETLFYAGFSKEDMENIPRYYANYIVNL